MSESRRILLLTPKLNGSDGISMVSRMSLNVLKELGNLEFIEVRSLGDQYFAPEQTGPGITCKSAYSSKIRFVRWGLRSLVSGDERFDTVFVLHIHLAPVALCSFRPGTRLSIFLHGIEAWKPLTMLQGAAIQRASIVIANSNHTAEQFKKANPGHSSLDIKVCHLGVPPLQAGGAGNEEQSFDGRYALIVGRMDPESRYKGHEPLIDVWRDVVKHAPGFKLMVVGDGPDRPRLQHKVKSCGLENEIKFLDLIDDRALFQLYRECSFFLMPSTGEGFGLVFLEAMRVGKACIAGIGAASEVVEDGITGLVVDPASREQLLGAILRFIDDPDGAHRMGHAGLQRFSRLFTAECFGRRLLQALELRPAGVPQCVG